MRTSVGTGPQKGHWGVEVSRAWNWVTDFEHKTSWHKQPYSQGAQDKQSLHSTKHFIVPFFN